eukprot:scaffold188596_cov30-Tisochrysis_lutea.AAC.1
MSGSMPDRGFQSEGMSGSMPGRGFQSEGVSGSMLGRGFHSEGVSGSMSGHKLCVQHRQICCKPDHRWSLSRAFFGLIDCARSLCVHLQGRLWRREKREVGELCEVCPRRSVVPPARRHNREEREIARGAVKVRA